MTRPASPAASVTIHADGHPARVPAGVSVAAALASLGHLTVRRSVTGEARGPLCGMGTCYECRVTIDGAAHRRGCLILVADGMRVDTAVAPAAEAAP
ncbi:MAG TPA: (2Fe-2S)-binding protein [Gemmatimonadaceae bacterium]|nr:(2Fe-2S)-binding protein [Gemmatimonadaceae bacterium]